MKQSRSLWVIYQLSLNEEMSGRIKALQLKTQNINAFRLPLWKVTFDIVFSGMALLCLSSLLIFTALATRTRK
ncbi:hypothetical protein NXW09_28075 [Bacteroides ovatus]|nr:hypothetical protein [Bacteroides ovatus]